MSDPWVVEAGIANPKDGKGRAQGGRWVKAGEAPDVLHAVIAVRALAERHGCARATRGQDEVTMRRHHSVEDHYAAATKYSESLED